MLLEDFQFDFNDLGLVKGDVDVNYSTFRTPNGFGIKIEIVSVVLHSEEITVKQEKLLAMCNDEFNAVHDSIRDLVIDRVAREVA